VGIFRESCLEVLDRLRIVFSPPWNTETELEQRLSFDEIFFYQLLGKSDMSGIEAFQLRFYTRILDELRLLPQPVRRTQIHRITEIDTAAVECAHFRQQFTDRLVAFLRRLHIRSLPGLIRVVHIRDEVTAAAGCQIDDDILVGFTDQADRFTEQFRIMADASCLRITHMQVGNCSAGFRRPDCRIRYLLWCHRYIFVLFHCISSACYRRSKHYFPSQNYRPPLSFGSTRSLVYQPVGIFSTVSLHSFFISQYSCSDDRVLSCA